MSRERDPRVRLDDMVAYATEAMGFVAGMTFDEFVADPRTQRAVSYSLLVVGEASKHVPASVQARDPGVDWVGAIRFRDRAAHGYDAIDLSAVWEVLHGALPAYRDRVAALLATLDAEAERGV